MDLMSLKEPSAKTRKFGVADRPRLFQPIELFDFICGTKTNDASKLFTHLLSLLHVALRHAPTLRDQRCIFFRGTPYDLTRSVPKTDMLNSQTSPRGCPVLPAHRNPLVATGSVGGISSYNSACKK
jgi:hypothetical protein